MTEVRPINYSKQSAGALMAICELRDHIDFLKDFDPRTAVQTTPPPFKMTHNQYQLLLGRACRTVLATMQMGGAREEVERASKFALIALDAEKHLLDVDEAKEKYGFKELEDKYVRGVKSE